jgi:hypothetical protein
MKFQTMWFQSVFIVILGLACALAANAATLTTDPLTGLLIDPATDPNHFGNEPVKIPDTQICKSKMQANFYMIANAKIDAASAWYAAHLPDFHKVHQYVDNRPQDKFYNDAGTLLVLVLGSVGKEGENVDTYGITYYSFQPGLPAKARISFGQKKMVCQ